MNRLLRRLASGEIHRSVILIIILDVVITLGQDFKLPVSLLMVLFETIKEKNIALVVWNTEKENDAHVYLGKIIEKEGDYYFLNESRKWNVPLSSEHLQKLKSVPQDLKEVLLNADFYFSMSMGNIPDTSNEGFVQTGLK